MLLEFKVRSDTQDKKNKKHILDKGIENKTGHTQQTCIKYLKQ